jgi:hypothetical protein
VPDGGKVVADSSFYLVFLKDIDKPQCLKRIVDAHDFLMPERVNAEVKRNLVGSQKSINYQHVERNPQIEIWDNQVFFPESLIAIWLDIHRKESGEHDVIAQCCRLYGRNESFCVIVDDSGARNLIDNEFDFLSIFMIWTTDFIKECHCIAQIFSKEECTRIIDAMESVQSLWVTHEICEEVRNSIAKC